MKYLCHFLFLLFVNYACISEHSSHHETKRNINLHEQNILMGESLKSFEKNKNVMFVQPDFSKEFNEDFQSYYGDLNMLSKGKFECTFIQNKLENFTYSIHLNPLQVDSLPHTLKKLAKHYTLLNHQENVEKLINEHTIIFIDYLYTEKMIITLKNDKTYLVYSIYSSLYKNRVSK